MDATYPRFQKIADHSVLVEFAEQVEEAAHETVLALDAAISGANLPGVVDVVPAMVSLLVLFDPLITDHDQIAGALRQLIGRPAARAKTRRQHDVAVCYDPAFAPDLAEVSARTGLSPEEVIKTHLSGDYRVYMYGFAPGYAYLAGLPPALRLDRKTQPVPNIPAGAVIIAGAQALVTTLTMPTGWWIIGRSPTRILTGDDTAPFLFDVDDAIRFRQIDMAQYKALASDG